MATRFELALHGEDPAQLRAAGEEAIAEIERLEDQLSLYRPTSEIACVNARAAFEPVRVSPAVFQLLQHARQLHHETGGAFDISIAPLVRCWGFMGDSGHMPSDEEVALAREKIGMDQIRLDEKRLTVKFARSGMMLDLGAIGKGYAIESAAEILREASVTSALLHGGTSTAYALGHPPDADFWKVAIERPPDFVSLPEIRLPTLLLRDEAMSVSAVWGRAFQADGKVLGHVLDPRTGRPAQNGLMAAVALPSATETDAFSTALLTLGPGGHERIAQTRPGMKTLLQLGANEDFRLESKGINV
jgi:thiamine biosynthesis lipoprotein